MKALSILFILIPASFFVVNRFRTFLCNGEITTYFFVQIAVLRVSSRMPDRFCREKRLRQDWERRLDAEKQKNCPQRNAAGGLPACVGMRSDAFKSHVLIVERRSDLDEQNSAASSGSFRFDDAAFEPGRPADGPIFCVWAGAEADATCYESVPVSSGWSFGTWVCPRMRHADQKNDRRGRKNAFLCHMDSYRWWTDGCHAGSW